MGDWRYENVLKLDCGCTTLGIYYKLLICTLCMVNCVECELHLIKAVKEKKSYAGVSFKICHIFYEHFSK